MIKQFGLKELCLHISQSSTRFRSKKNVLNSIINHLVAVVWLNLLQIIFVFFYHSVYFVPSLKRKCAANIITLTELYDVELRGFLEKYIRKNFYFTTLAIYLADTIVPWYQNYVMDIWAHMNSAVFCFQNQKNYETSDLKEMGHLSKLTLCCLKKSRQE